MATEEGPAVTGRRGPDLPLLSGRGNLVRARREWEGERD
jgi:hypothetical protein